DTGNLLKLPHELALEHTREIGQRAALQRAAAEHDDRGLVRVELANLGRLDLVRKVLAYAVERAADVVRRLVEIRALRELQPNLGAPLRRRRLHALEIRHARDRILDALRDDELHLLGADVAVAHANGKLRKLDRRKEIDGQEAEADHPERDDDQEDPRRRDGPLYRNSGDAQFSPSVRLANGVASGLVERFGAPAEPIVLLLDELQQVARLHLLEPQNVIPRRGLHERKPAVVRREQVMTERDDPLPRLDAADGRRLPAARGHLHGHEAHGHGTDGIERLGIERGLARLSRRAGFL